MVMSPDQSFYRSFQVSRRERGSLFTALASDERNTETSRGSTVWGRLNAERQTALHDPPETERPPTQEVPRKMVLNRCGDASCRHLRQPPCGNLLSAPGRPQPAVGTALNCLCNYYKQINKTEESHYFAKRSCPARINSQAEITKLKS